MEKLDKALDEVINCIKSSKEYQDCLSIKKKMDDNTEIKELINNIKKLQKKYVRSNYDSKIKEELDLLEEKINNIPIYHVYLEKLETVNQQIDYVRDSLNDYFYSLVNKKY